MALHETPLHEVDLPALQRLIDHKVGETLRLEYKRVLPTKQEDSRREFLKDVSAFANAAGGDLLYGVDEEDSVAKELVGVGNEDVPALLNLLRDSIEPRIPGIDHRFVELGEDRGVVIFRVPSSVHGPHMVRLGNYRQFFIRGSTGSHPMSTSEVRQVVLKTADWRERADAWRRERVALIQRGEGPCTLDDAMPLIVHVVPLQDAELDLTPEPVRRRLTDQCPHGGDRLTFDGFLTATGTGILGQPTWTYTLWFNDGRAERVRTRLIESNGTFFGPDIDRRLEESVQQLIAGLSSVGRRPPMLVLATLVAHRGMQIANPQRRHMGPFGSSPLDRDVLFLPPLLIEEHPSNWWTTLAPTINRIWQAFGHPRSPFSKEDGTRIDEWR
jgi:hypothetical protein